MTVGGAVVNALAFSDTNFVFSRPTDYGAEEHKRHDLALENLQKARDSVLTLSEKDCVKKIR